MSRPILHRNKRASIRSQLLASMHTAVIGGIALSALVAVFLQIRLADQQLRTDMQILAEILGNRSVATLVFKDSAAATRNLEAARSNPAVEYICLYTLDHQLFAEYHARGPRQPCPQHWQSVQTWAQRGSTDLLHLTVATDIVDQGNAVGSLMLHADKKFVVESVGMFLLVFVLIVVLTTLAVTVMTRRRLNTLMTPLEDLYATAVDITQDPLSGKRATRISDDEIGELVDVFNRMLDNIAQEHRSLTTSEQRFRALAASSPIGLTERDALGQITYANPRWHQITGLLPSQLDARHYEQRILPQDLATYQAACAQSWQRHEVAVVEYRYLNPCHGREIFLLEYIAPLNDHADAHQGFIASLMDISELKNAQLELERLAFYDPLTQLPNRRFFREHLGYVIAEGRKHTLKAAVGILDLDDFKKINDTLGHDTGDQLLISIAQRIQKAVFAQDVVSRMGGDEFLILLTGIEDAERATLIGERILKAVSLQEEITGHAVQISASLGIALFPDDGLTAESLIKNADMALYRAKDSGRNRLNFFSEDLDRQIKETVRLETRLKRALDEDRLTLYLQPLYSTQADRVVAAESLLRWNDPEEGMISPTRFIPLAEELGLIERFGSWVIHRICRLLSEQGSVLRSVGIEEISVNLSARQFYSKHLLAEVEQCLREYGVSAGRLGFEITESMVMKDTKLAIEIMHGLRDLGCSLSMDDFGTGYSSLSCLQRFPIDTLKIDRSFVMEIPHNPNAVEISTTIIAMAHKLGHAVVAEGVETEQQRQFLIEQGCELLQGYLIGRPAEPQQVIEHLRKSTLRRVK
ncbi:MAG: EAL domain-containing protein [Gammaproteobacteria bacterium]|nr:EAL domain-containing protein [Gammaproteobacteria bacterium]